MAKGLEFKAHEVNAKGTQGNVSHAFADGILYLAVPITDAPPMRTSNGAAMHGATYMTVKDPESGIKVRLNAQFYEVISKNTLREENEAQAQRIAELEAMIGK